VAIATDAKPNAVLNLTHARSFPEFVHQVRHDRESHVLFMPQYAEPMQLRVIQTLLDVIRLQPGRGRGRARWDDRVMHPNGDGVDQPVSCLWNKHLHSLRRFSQAFVLFEAAPVQNVFRAAMRQGRPDIEQPEIDLSLRQSQEVRP